MSQGFESLPEFESGPPQTPFHRALGETHLGGDLRHFPALQVERLQNPGLGRPDPGQPPAQGRGVIRGIPVRSVPQIPELPILRETLQGNHGSPTVVVAEEIARHPGWKLDVWIKRLTSELFAAPLVAQVLSKRLIAMSEWLLLAKDEPRARQALVAARSILEGPVQDQPLLQAIVQRDLNQALASLHDSEPDSGMKQYQ